jgi:hypothetical protein
LIVSRLVAALVIVAAVKAKRAASVQALEENYDHPGCWLLFGQFEAK